MILEANLDVLQSLHRFYLRLSELKDMPQSLKDECAYDLDSFQSHLDNITHEFKMHISRAKLLANIINDRKGLVSRISPQRCRSSSFVQISQHLQGQAAERAEELTLNMEREAVVMRIVTIVTLIYLPATFVSVSQKICRKG